MPCHRRATEWDEFVTYDWQKIYDSMQNQLLFFDGRNLLNGITRNWLCLSGHWFLNP
jgi:hypothetical protein